MGEGFGGKNLLSSSLLRKVKAIFSRKRGEVCPGGYRQRRLLIQTGCQEGDSGVSILRPLHSMKGRPITAYYRVNIRPVREQFI